MLIRKAALLASVFSGLFGVSQADAACFGKRNCCQATPVVCNPCPTPAPAPTVCNSCTTPAPTVSYSYAPVVTTSCSPTVCQPATISSSCCYNACDPCSSSYAHSTTVSFEPLAMQTYSTQSSQVTGSGSPVLQQIQQRVDNIDVKVDRLLQRP